MNTEKLQRLIFGSQRRSVAIRSFLEQPLSEQLILFELDW